MTEATVRRQKRIAAEDIEDERDDGKVPWDEEQDDPPVKAKAKRRTPAVVEDDDDDDDEEQYRKSTKSAHRKPPPADDDEDGLDEFTKPSQRAKGKPSLSDDEKPIRRKQPRDEYEAEESGEETSIPFSRSWEAVLSKKSGDGGIYFRWPDDGDQSLVKFLDEEPWTYSMHWVTRSGKQSFPCVGKGCPLCEIGAKSTAKAVFAILNLSAQNGPTVQALEVNTSTAATLAGFHKDKKTGPLSRLWWAISRSKGALSGSIQQYSYSFLPVKDRDLDEDWDIALDDAEAAYSRAEPLDPKKVLGNTNRRVLQEIADEVMDR